VILAFINCAIYQGFTFLNNITPTRAKAKTRIGYQKCEPAEYIPYPFIPWAIKATIKNAHFDSHDIH